MRLLLIFLITFSLEAFGQTDSLNLSSGAKTDTTAKKIPQDTIVFQSFAPQYNESEIVADSFYLRHDYRYSADFLRSFGGWFIRSSGTVGVPEEYSFDGLSGNSLGLFNNGLALNERTSRTYNLNLLASESLDSIEIIPLPRSFLLGSDNYSAAINFIPTTRISRLAYTRIRYYQAPDGEGMLDLRFQKLMYHKFNLAVELFNQKKDDGYQNTDVSNWGLNASISYPFSTRLTVFFDYAYNRYVPGLFGGVDYDTVRAIYKDPERVLYDAILAPIVTPECYQKQQQNTFRLTGRYIRSSTSLAEVSLYTRDNLIEFRQNEDLANGDPDRFVFNRSQKIIGFQGKFYESLSWIDLTLNAGIEHNSGNDFYLFNTANSDRLYFSSVISSKQFNSSFYPSLFGKFLKINGAVYSGFGFDISSRIDSSYSFYLGASSFKRSEFDGSQSTNLLLQSKLKYFSPKLRLLLDIYYHRNSELSSVNNYLRIYRSTIDTVSAFSPYPNAFGINLSADYLYDWLRVESALSFTFQDKSVLSENTLPMVHGRIGIYYSGVHFNANLNVKSGLDCNFYTAFTPAAYDAFYVTTYYDPSLTTASAHIGFNFFTSAEIQQSAIVYFTWENLLDAQYYVSAYYPMPRRGIRFGIAWELFN